jgi:hypothetical protein
VCTASIIIALMVESVHSPETAICFHETTRRWIPESCHLHTRRRENLKFQPIEFKLI